ncbi:ATP-binding protein [Pseudomonas jessenii]|uniref:ATP-binding protein n=1 Tax=Pseudomonas jessenii TaxID=77298 RepID=UPI0032E3CB09
MIKHKLSSSFSSGLILHPCFALRLIGCLSVAVVLGVLGSIAMYCYATVMSEVSDYRKVFNNGYTQSRDFFESKELLLAGIIKSVDLVPDTTAATNVQIRKPFHLGVDTKVGGREELLHLSAQLRQDLKESNVNIIYVNRATGEAQYIFKAQSGVSDSLKEVSTQLQDAELDNNQSARKLFRLGSGDERKSYVFEPISPHLMSAVWLGLEVPYKQVQESIAHEIDAVPELSIHYLLLDANGKLVGGAPEGEPVDDVFLDALKRQTEGFSSFSAPIFKISLKKELGGRQRWVVYYASYLDIFWQVKNAFLFGLGLFVASIVFVYVSMRYIKRAVFLPAQEQALQLLEREAFNRTMLELAPVGICVLNRKTGELLIQSEKAKRLLALSVETKGHQSLREYFLTIPLNGPGIPLRMGVAAFAANDRTPCYIQVSLAALQYNDQPVLFCSFVDDSERRNAELMLAAAKEAADQANTAKSTFLAMMSHEIRTPLYGVLGTLELLGNTALLPHQRDYLRTIELSSSNLLQIINDILDFSKIEANQLALEAESFNLVELVEGVALGFVPLARKKRVQLYCCLQPDLPLLIGDSNRIQQVLSNLLSNAVKFTDSGKIVVRLVATQIESGEVHIRLQITDSGAGISKKSQAMLFEPFIQADNSTSRRFGGTGLGLTICRRLARLMGGEIELVSELGLGSSFTLSLQLPAAGPSKSIRLGGLSTVQIAAGAYDQREALRDPILHAGSQAQPHRCVHLASTREGLATKSSDSLCSWFRQHCLTGS